MSQALLTLTDVRLTLPAASGPVEILKGIDLSIARGETVSLVGPSGSGKTSLLLLIAGLEHLSAGDITLAGASLAKLSEDERAKLRRDSIGIVFQNFHLVPTMTALENVAVPLELAGRVDAFDRAAAALTAVGLGHRTSHYPAQLSGGEQQRVALARAIAVKPKLILADEPTGNLDAATGETIVELLFRLASEEGATLLLITHDKNLAARCRRQLSLADGRLLADSRS